MPFSIEMYDKDGKATGKFIVDRNLLIFAFVDEETCNLFRMFDQYIDTRCMELSSDTFAETEDPRHDALEHVSQYDRHQFHLHYIFTKDVLFKIVKLLFDRFEDRYKRDKSLDLIMSKQCREEIVATTERYFEWLSNSPDGRVIEQQYRSMKDREFKEAEAQVLREAKEQSSVALLVPTDRVIRIDPQTMMMITALMSAGQNGQMLLIPSFGQSGPVDRKAETATVSGASLFFRTAPTPIQAQSTPVQVQQSGKQDKDDTACNMCVIL
jgi:hypothetical protein